MKTNTPSPSVKKAQHENECNWWIVNDDGVKAGPLCENPAYLARQGDDVMLRAMNKPAALMKYRQMQMGVAASRKYHGWLKRAMANGGQP